MRELEISFKDEKDFTLKQRESETSRVKLDLEL